MALLKDGKVTDDTFVDATDADTLPAAGALIVSLQQWQDNREQLAARTDPLGVRLRSEEKPEEIADDLRNFAVVALEFPAFADGRAYSYARLLRDRFGFTGELRAVGDVLLEQLHFMHRVGFDAFEISDADAVEAWETAAADISVWYQPTNDGRPSVLQLRHD